MFYEENHLMESTGQSSIQASKSFKTPVSALYQAWTDAEQLKQWWKPMGLTLNNVENEITEGGKVTYHFSGDEGTSLTIEGSYQEVKPNERLVYTWNWQLPDEKLNSAYKLEVAFEGSAEESSISITQTEEEQQESVKPKESAWDDQLSKLAQFLESGAQGSASNGGSGSPRGLSNAQSQDAGSSDIDQEGKPDYGSQNPLQNQ
jgi:uncharacterized protein YndB with AHSA1/START domain